MGLVTGLLTLPLAPVRGVVWIAEQVHQVALQEVADPARLRSRLDEIEQAREAGEIDEQEAARLEEELIGRLLDVRPPPVAGRSEGADGEA
ncbi:gas vesicle protein GvpG [Peterkaempfera bronchialis]|uniref:Gas vesicle protein n=1 Tax=Peterkaempfera bronchialis TaxID=2126346 RepID=A0A345SVY9_9ACTN|nr:gas vesicle protein GvpG [Peterkaempfera bronchialis]AXI77894.1 gas vesicle protein [Peterkaempfera bronchialis]